MTSTTKISLLVLGALAIFTLLILIALAFLPAAQPMPEGRTTSVCPQKEISENEIAKAKEVQKRHLYLLFIPKIVGTGIGSRRSQDDTCEVFVRFYVERNTLLLKWLFPRTLEGIPVKIEVTGGFSSELPQGSPMLDQGKVQ